MIWFDASLERPIEDERLQRGIAAMLAIASESVIPIEADASRLGHDMTSNATRLEGFH